MGEIQHQNYVKEHKIGDNPDSLTAEQMRQALYQMEISICKIKKENNIFGTGFFCKIPFPNKLTLLPVLITCNHVLDIDDIAKGKKINFSLNDEKLKYSIIIDKSRITYTNIKYDVTIIEIRPEEDNININSFLDVDENTDKDNPNDTYKNKCIYILHYEEGKNMKYSIGNIKSIAEDNFNIRHLCTTNVGSSGCPMINLFNYKVMGVHKGYKNKFNLGTHLKIVIEEFNKNNSKNNNIILNRPGKLPFKDLASSERSTIITTSPIDYIINAIKLNDFSFYQLKNDKRFRSISIINNKIVDDDIFIFRVYTSIYYVFLSEYMRKGEVLESYHSLKGFSKSLLDSFICCLQNALFKNKNVKDGTITYKGIKLRFPKDITVGSKFYFRNFVSTSIKEDFCKAWIKNEGTIFVINIKNNGTNNQSNYCFYVEDISMTKHQYEIVFASHCQFVVDKIEKKDKLDYVYLTCEGYLLELFNIL